MLTPDQIATAVLRERRGRSQVFQLRNKIWRWLLSTPWFAAVYPEQHQQVILVDEVEKIIRSRWARKSALTRSKNKSRKLKTEDPRQLKLL